MFDHVAIAVSDLAASERFYRTVLSVLGAEPSRADAELVEWEDWDIGATDREHPVTRVGGEVVHQGHGDRPAYGGLHACRGAQLGVRLRHLDVHDPAGDVGGHGQAGHLVLSADGSTLYASVGSNSNAAERGIEAEKGRAAIWEIDRETGVHSR